MCGWALCVSSPPRAGIGPVLGRQHTCHLHHPTTQALASCAGLENGTCLAEVHRHSPTPRCLSVSAAQWGKNRMLGKQSVIRGRCSLCEGGRLGDPSTGPPKQHCCSFLPCGVWTVVGVCLPYPNVSCCQGPVSVSRRSRVRCLLIVPTVFMNQLSRRIWIADERPSTAVRESHFACGTRMSLLATTAPAHQCKGHRSCCLGPENLGSLG